MNTYRIYIKQDGLFKPVNGTVVYPLTFNRNLDERLDDAYIEIINSSVKQYAPYTELKIVLGTAEMYMVISSDSPRKKLFTSLYDHSIYAIERTKLLSTIYCSSITFTNKLGASSTPKFDLQLVPAETPNWQHQGGTTFTFPSIPSPILSDTWRFIKTTGELAEAGTDYIYKGVPLPYNPSAEWLNPPYDLPAFTPRFYTIDYMCSLAASAIQSGNPRHHVRPDLSSIEVYIGRNLYRTLVMYETGRVLGDGESFDVADTSYVANDTNGSPMHSNTAITDLNTGSYQTPIFTIPSDILPINETISFVYKIAYSLYQDGSKSGEWIGRYNIAATKEAEGLRTNTITDVVNRILLTAEPIPESKEPRFKFNSSQAEFYSSVEAPDLSMTQCTLREQLKVVGNVIHAEPRLSGSDEIWFDPFVGGEEWQARGLLIGESGTWDSNEYNTEIRSNAQNLTSTVGYGSGKSADPARDVPKTVRNEGGYAQITDTNAIALTQFPIYSIVAVKCSVRGADGAYSALASEVDITAFVYEETQYRSRLSAYKAVYPYSRAYALYYTMGQKSVKGLFNTTMEDTEQALTQAYPIANILALVHKLDTSGVQDYLSGANDGQPRFADVCFNITYRPIYPTFIGHGKTYSNVPRCVLPYNQSENIIEARYYGENMKGASARMGNAEQISTFLVPSLEDVPKAGMSYNGMTISTVAVDYSATRIKCSLGLTKAFNRLSEYVGVPTVKRMYEVSERQTSNRDILIHNTVVISTEDKRFPEDRTIALATAPGLQADCFYSCLKLMIEGRGSLPISDDQTPASCAVSVGYNGTGQARTPQTPTLLPVIASAFGNAMTFYYSYLDNYSAGISAEAERIETEDTYFTNDVPYADYYGKLTSLDYILLNNKGVSALKSAYGLNPYSLPAFASGETEQIVETSKANGVLSTAERYAISKDSREKISITSEIEFKTDSDNLVVGSALASMFPLVSSEIAEMARYSGAELYVIYDKAYLPDRFAHRFIPNAEAIAQEKYSNYLEATVGRIDGSRWFIDVDDTLQHTPKYYGWVLVSPSNVVKEEYIDTLTNETVTAEEERGYNILLTSYDGGNANSVYIPRLYLNLINQ